MRGLKQKKIYIVYRSMIYFWNIFFLVSWSVGRRHLSYQHLYNWLDAVTKLDMNINVKLVMLFDSKFESILIGNHVHVIDYYHLKYILLSARFLFEEREGERKKKWCVLLLSHFFMVSELNKNVSITSITCHQKFSWVTCFHFMTFFNGHTFFMAKTQNWKSY